MHLLIMRAIDFHFIFALLPFHLFVWNRLQRGSRSLQTLFFLFFSRPQLQCTFSTLLRYFLFRNAFLAKYTDFVIRKSIKIMSKTAATRHSIVTTEFYLFVHLFAFIIDASLSSASASRFFGEKAIHTQKHSSTVCFTDSVCHSTFLLRSLLWCIVSLLYCRSVQMHNLLQYCIYLCAKQNQSFTAKRWPCWQ